MQLLIASDGFMLEERKPEQHNMWNFSGGGRGCFFFTVQRGCTGTGWGGIPLRVKGVGGGVGCQLRKNIKNYIKGEREGR
jgi:hypothetical protein